MKKTIITYICDQCKNEIPKSHGSGFVSYKLIPTEYREWELYEKDELHFCNKECFKEFVTGV